VSKADQVKHIEKIGGTGIGPLIEEIKIGSVVVLTKNHTLPPTKRAGIPLGIELGLGIGVKNRVKNRVSVKG
jgi:hypothetical protein